MKIDIIERDGVVTATDGRKVQVFEPDPINEVDPMEAARLYASYLELLNSCPGAAKYVRESPRAVADESTPTPSAFFQLKPQKITIRILEGERIS